MANARRYGTCAGTGPDTASLAKVAGGETPYFTLVFISRISDGMVSVDKTLRSHSLSSAELQKAHSVYLSSSTACCSAPRAHSTLAQPWCRSLFGASRYVERPTWAADGCPQPCVVDAMGPAEGAAAAPGAGGGPAVPSAQQVLLAIVLLAAGPLTALCTPVSGAVRLSFALMVACILLRLLQAGAFWCVGALRRTTFTPSTAMSDQHRQADSSVLVAGVVAGVAGHRVHQRQGRHAERGRCQSQAGVLRFQDRSCKQPTAPPLCALASARS